MIVTICRSKLKRLFSFLLCVTLLGAGLIQGVCADDAYSSYISLPPVKLDLKESYLNYLQKHQSAARPEQSIEIDATKYSGSSYQPQINSDALITKEDGYVEWQFDVPQAGLYCIKLNICQSAENLLLLSAVS